MRTLKQHNSISKCFKKKSCKSIASIALKYIYILQILTVSKIWHLNEALECGLLMSCIVFQNIIKRKTVMRIKD